MTARAGDRVMAVLARLLLRVFFRRIDVEGAARLPAGPVLLVANHVNGLVDGLVLMAVLPRYPRFLGKATLYRILPLAPFLHLAGVVPVHRTTDAADRGSAAARAVTRNDTAFRTCADAARPGRPGGACSPKASATTRHGYSRCAPARHASRSALPSTTG